MYFDAVVAGGSIAGLLCAREIAAGGHSVAVIEEGSEIGTPEHCGGLVSRAALEELGVAAGQGARGGGGGGAAIESARITAPDGRSFTVGARRQGVVGIDRRELDKRVAFQAQEKGAAIMVGTSLRDWDAAGGRISTNRGAIGCRIMVDATGASSLARRDRTGILPSAQYEVYADWIADGRVEVAIDSRRYPGFFAWVIPSGGGRGRVGVAGRGINAARALEAFLEERDGWGAGRARAGDGGGGGRGDGGGGGGGRHSTIRKIFAPIWVNGPIRDFVDGRRVVVGDAAGQAKPTTGGGIFTSGMGGVLAGQAISGFLGTGDPADLREYQRRWTDRFGREFERQLLARRILERMDNDAICGLFGSITPEVTREISENDDFDFHTGSIMRVLGIRGAARAAGAVAGSELRRLAGRGAAGRTP